MREKVGYRNVSASQTNEGTGFRRQSSGGSERERKREKVRKRERESVCVCV